MIKYKFENIISLEKIKEVIYDLERCRTNEQVKKILKEHKLYVICTTMDLRTGIIESELAIAH